MTSGLSAVLGVNPHEAAFSLRKFADFLLPPQYAVTKTSSTSH
jgi:hypothetical protein